MLKNTIMNFMNTQTSLFKEFSSTKIINNEDKFFNLLVKDDNDTKPLKK